MLQLAQATAQYTGKQASKTPPGQHPVRNAWGVLPHAHSCFQQTVCNTQATTTQRPPPTTGSVLTLCGARRADPLRLAKAYTNQARLPTPNQH